MLDFTTTYAPQLAWIIAAIGWAVAHQQANGREKRKEIRSEVEDICTLVMSTLAEFQQYRGTVAGSTESVKHELQVKLSLEDISLRLERLKQRKGFSGPTLPDLDDAEQKLGTFFDTITGGDFESLERKEGPDEKMVVLHAVRQALVLTDSLRRSFLNAFE